MTFSLLFQDLDHVPARRAADSPSAVDSASAEIQVIERGLVLRPARDGTHEHELIEHQLTMVEVAFGETVGGLQVLRSDSLFIYD